MRTLLATIVTLAFIVSACGGSAGTPAPVAASAAPAATVAAATAAPTPTPAPAPVKLIVGFSEIYEGAIPMWYALSSGVFKKNGLDVDLRYTASSTGVAALLANETQIFQGGGSEVLSAVVGGADFVTFGNLVPVYPYVFMAPASIKTVADLKGKTVGVSNPGSTSDIATRVGLAKEGLVPDKDVTIVAVGSSQNRTAALIAGSILGGLDQPPGMVTLQDKGFHILFDMAAQKLPVVNNGLTAKRDWLNANRATVQKYVDSIVQAISALRTDRAGAYAVIKKELKVDDERTQKITYDFAMTIFPAAPYAQVEHFADSVKVLGEKNAKILNFDVSKILDPSFVKSAVDRGLAK